MVFTFLLSGCGNHYVKTLDPDKVEIKDAMTNNGEEVVGKRGIIYIKPAKINKLSYEEIKSFLKWIDSQRDELKWVTIDFGDGYAIEFLGCMSFAGIYGPLDVDERVVKDDARLVDEKNYYVLCTIDDKTDSYIPVTQSKLPYGINGLTDNK